MLNYGTQPDLLGPLTAAQWSIWAAQQLRPEVPYNFAGFLALDHDVDAERLFAPCESAATRFGSPCARIAVADGEPVYVVDRAIPQALDCIDLRAERDPVAAARSWMENDYCQPVDLLRDRLINIALLRIADDFSYFYLRTHHVLLDGYATYSFLRHVAAVYSGAPAETGEIDFSGFAAIRDADQKYLVSGANEQRLRYHTADREALGVEPVDDHIAGGAQCVDTVARRSRCMSGQQRGKSLSGQRNGVGVVPEHDGESGIGEDDDAVESGGEHRYRQSVRRRQRGQRVDIFFRALRREVMTPTCFVARGQPTHEPRRHCRRIVS